ncbi:MAG TPA: sugar ABC transporter permease [Trueperaceae bacterium]
MVQGLTQQETIGASASRRTPRLRWLGPYLLLLPAFAFIAVFVFWPVIYSVYLSLQDWRLGFGSSRFVGMRNYVRLFSAPDFLNALRVTVGYTLLTSCGSIVLGLALALAIQHVRRLGSAWQALFFLPVASTMAAMAVVFRFMFDTHIGVINAVLARIGLGRVDWLNGDLTAFAAVVVVGIWSSAGYAMVLFLAGLTTIPENLHEAAALDGASSWQQLRFITLPLLTPTTIFVVVILTLRSLESFDNVKVLTDGGPLGATQVLSHLLYVEGFRYFNTGYASALATVFFVILLVVAIVQMRAERWVHYE